MKALHTENFYRKYWGEFQSKSKMNLDRELKWRTDGMNDVLDAENLKRAMKVVAKLIADEAEAELRKTMKMVQDLEAGRSSLGYTHELQEVAEMARLRRMFEFDCLQLRDFREKWA